MGGGCAIDDRVRYVVGALDDGMSDEKPKQAGKGDKPRPRDPDKWVEGYDGIDWGKKLVDKGRNSR